jgi:hypothetical protein
VSEFRSKMGILVLGALLLGTPGWAQQGDETDEAVQDTASDEPVFRRPHLMGWGVRFGVANEPDQVLGGIQLDLGSIADRVYAEPSFELGVGDDHTTLKATAALHFRLSPNRRVRPYFGGGISMALDYHDPPDRGSDTDIDLSLRALGGVAWVLKSRRQFFIEGAVIFGNPHDYAVVVGWRF